MVQTAWVLGQPTLVARRLRRLADMSRFCRGELARFGIHVWGDDGTPMLPVYTGRPTYAARLSYVVRGYRLLASPIVAPAVPYWEGRVRINLSAEHTNEDVDKLIDAVLKGSADLGLCNSKGIKEAAIQVCRAGCRVLAGRVGSFRYFRQYPRQHSQQRGVSSNGHEQVLGSFQQSMRTTCH